VCHAPFVFTGSVFLTSWQSLHDEADEPHWADAGRGQTMTAMIAIVTAINNMKPMCFLGMIS